MAAKMCDVIEELQRNCLDHILEKILGYLDYECLKQAALVSAVWLKAIAERRFWKQLFSQNVVCLPNWKEMYAALKEMKHRLSGEESDVGYYYKLCCTIETELQRTDKNWENMEYRLRKTRKMKGCGRLLNSFVVVSGDWIVGIQPINGGRDERQNDDTFNVMNNIFILNRWTLKTEKVLEIPIEHLSDLDGRIPRFKSVKVNERFIVASFCFHPEICIWDAKSRELSFYPCVSLRRLPSKRGGRVITLHRDWEAIGRGGDVWEFAMDKNYVLLFCTKNLETKSSQIQIRSTSSFEILNTILLDDGRTEFAFRPYVFHYLNGLIVTGFEAFGGSKGKWIRIWDAATGKSIKKIPCCDKLTAVRLVSDKYIVSCDLEGNMKVWDLKSLLTMEICDRCSNHKSSADLLLKTMPGPQKCYRFSPSTTLVSADKFQIVIADMDQYEDDCSCIYVKSFVGNMASK